MLRSLIALCLARRPLVLVAFAVFLGIGFAAFTTLNIEAYPDPAPPIIELIAQWPGQSPEEVERYVTIPIEIAVSSTPGLKYLRSNTVYALGFIRLQFDYGRDYHFVRQQTLNRLKDVTLPNGVTPVISPAGGISEIMRYQLKGPPNVSLTELKTLQDWVVERRLRTVPGIADVSVLGGKTKEFQAEVDLNRMMAYSLTLPQIITAISAGNSNVGGRTIAMGEQSVTVRGIGVVGTLQGYPQYRAFAAERRAGAAVRRGQGAGRLHAAAGHCRARRGHGHRHRHRADAEVRAHLRGGGARTRGDRPPQHRRDAPARRKDRFVLRSRRSGGDHREHGDAQHVLRHRPDIPHSVDVPGQPALRADCLGDHSGGVVPGGDHYGNARRICPPAFGRSDRSRHHRRRHRDHGGEHFPSSRPR